jgi:hypothetical protein
MDLYGKREIFKLAHGLAHQQKNYSGCYVISTQHCSHAVGARVISRRNCNRLRW